MLYAFLKSFDLKIYIYKNYYVYIFKKNNTNNFKFILREIDV